MKRKTFIYSSILLLFAVVASCTLKDGIDQDLSFINKVASSNTNKIFDITNDNS